MKKMSITEKINLVKSLNNGSYVYIEYKEGYAYISLVKDVEVADNSILVNEFASSCVDTIEENDDEVDFLYYNTNFILYKDDNTKGQPDYIRMATKEEIEHFDRLLKEDGNKYSNGKMKKL